MTFFQIRYTPVLSKHLSEKKHVDVLGCKVGFDGDSSFAQRIKATKKLAKPALTDELLRFFALVGFFNSVLDNFAQFQSRLYDVLENAAFLNKGQHGQ